MDATFTAGANLHLEHRMAGVDYQPGCSICPPPASEEAIGIKTYESADGKTLVEEEPAPVQSKKLGLLKFLFSRR